MSDKPEPHSDDQRRPAKDPDQWVTGDEPMTEAQRAFLRTLSERAGVAFDDQLTKAEASKRIDELRGQGGSSQRDTPDGGASGAQDAPGIKKDPDQWVTGDEPMTEAQRAYLEQLAGQIGAPVDDALTKAEASKRIDELRGHTDRSGG